MGGEHDQRPRSYSCRASTVQGSDAQEFKEIFHANPAMIILQLLQLKIYNGGTGDQEAEYE